MSDDDPRPLKSSGETPSELTHALRALGRDRDADRLARVAERLGASIAGSPAPSWASRLSWTKIGLTGLALGAFVLAYVLLAERGTPSAGAPRTPTVELPAQRREPAPAAPSIEASESIEPVGSPPPTAARQKRPPPAAARSAPRVHTHAPSVSPAGAAEASGAAISVEPAPASEEAAAVQPEPQPRPKPAPAAVVEQLSEVALLQQARSAASQQPAAALRLLQEHAERFPDGMLAPEREVLSIEVLRTLGRTNEAAQRLQQFEARYPKSIHLRRLQRGSAKNF